MVEQKRCGACGSRFFANDETDKFGEYYICSYCINRVSVCMFCGCAAIHRGKVDDNVGLLCAQCGKTLGRRYFRNKWLSLRFLAFNRDKFTCRYCGRSPLTDNGVKLHCDHIIPKSDGGEDIMTNLVTACRECNLGKIDVLLDDEMLAMISNRKIFPSKPD